jgi:DNA-binding ferritin-like protein
MSDESASTGATSLDKISNVYTVPEKISQVNQSVADLLNFLTANPNISVKQAGVVELLNNVQTGELSSWIAQMNAEYDKENVNTNGTIDPKGALLTKIMFGCAMYIKHLCWAICTNYVNGAYIDYKTSENLKIQRDILTRKLDELRQKIAQSGDILNAFDVSSEQTMLESITGTYIETLDTQVQEIMQKLKSVEDTLDEKLRQAGGKKLSKLTGGASIALPESVVGKASVHLGKLKNIATFINSLKTALRSSSEFLEQAKKSANDRVTQQAELINAEMEKIAQQTTKYIGFVESFANMPNGGSGGRGKTILDTVAGLTQQVAQVVDQSDQDLDDEGGDLNGEGRQE